MIAKFNCNKQPFTAEAQILKAPYFHILYAWHEYEQQFKLKENQEVIKGIFENCKF